MRQPIRFTLNGKAVTLTAEPDRLLLWALRTDFDLTGTKYGCGGGVCGACTVLVNGRPARACLTRLEAVRGNEVLTIEGLAQGETLHPLQEAFHEHGALQCGYCTPGMIMAAASYLKENPDPTEEQVRESLEGNLCRCTGYQNIVKSILDAAQQMSGAKA
jgi:carbon-monoxide dehydrogenase small subunit